MSALGAPLDHTAVETELLKFCGPSLDALPRANTGIPPSVELRYLHLAWTHFPNEKYVCFALEALWERLHLDKWSSVVSETRTHYALAGSLKAALLLRKRPKSVAHVRAALDILDRVLLMGPGGNAPVAQVAAKLHAHLPPAKLRGNLAVVCRSEELVEDVERVTRPSLRWFLKEALAAGRPVVVVGCMGDWEACVKWKDLEYLLRVAGHRLVPVELGHDYMDDSWSQKLMRLEEFVNGYLLPSSGKKRKKDEEGEDRDIRKGYMAQHELFNQIQELNADIVIPDYCSLYAEGEQGGGDVAVNMWFGPEGTASRMHFDPKNNLLAQVGGLLYTNGES